MTAELANPYQVPPVRSRAYYAAKSLAHRLQARLAGLPPDGRPVDGLRILAYHRICSARDDLAVAPDDFRRQMEALLRTGTRIVSLTDALEALDARSDEPLLCVTFDDGYRDNLDHAIPVLRQFGIPATIFVATGLSAGTTRTYWYREGREPPLLSFDELAEIDCDPLFDIGSHSRTHPALPELPDAAAWEEIAGSKNELEERLGHPVIAFAYPAGLHSPRDRRLVGEAGYLAALTTEPGPNHPAQPREALHRMFIDGRDTLRMFEAKLAGALDSPWGMDTLLRVRDRFETRIRTPSRELP
jgi:peptidoglycan/xylan/chitin deacetylase (PgdA/CDA1 family)